MKVFARVKIFLLSVLLLSFAVKSEVFAANPMDQFRIHKIWDISVFGYDVSLTNSGLIMLISVGFFLLLSFLAVRKKSLIPGRLQSAMEMLYDFISNMVKSGAGDSAHKFVPFIFSLFVFVLFGNVFGLLPYSYTITSQIIVTFMLAAILFLVIIIAGIIKYKAGFLAIILPPGIPMVLAPLMIVVELFAYLARPMSLAIRLSANMTVGHTMLKIIAGFVFPLGLLMGWLPLIFLMVLNIFELFVAVLQAYIFTVLACSYLRDATDLSH